MAKKTIMILLGGGHTGYMRILIEELHGRAKLSFLAPVDDTISYSEMEPFGLVRTLMKPYPRGL